MLGPIGADTPVNLWIIVQMLFARSDGVYRTQNQSEKGRLADQSGRGS